MRSWKRENISYVSVVLALILLCLLVLVIGALLNIGGLFVTDSDRYASLPTSVPTRSLEATYVTATSWLQVRDSGAIYSTPMRGPALNCRTVFSITLTATNADTHPSSGRINAYSVISESDIWAVGIVFSGTGGIEQSLAVHWDGAHWHIVPTPTVRDKPTVLNAITAIKSDDVWAIGYWVDAFQPGVGDDIRPLALHWNGARWKAVPIAGNVALNSVAAVSSKDLWAAGSLIVAPHSASVPQMLHWNGFGWTSVPLPDEDPDSDIGKHIDALSAASSVDVWAAGSDLLHWDGSHWTKVVVPVQGITEFTGVVALGHSDVWATLRLGTKSLLLHWDGGRWTEQTAAVAMLGNAYKLSSLAGTQNNIWVLVLGTAYAGSGVNPGAPHDSSGTRLVHWNGQDWSMVEDQGCDGCAPAAITTVTENALWITGTQDRGPNYNPLLIYYRRTPCP